MLIIDRRYGKPLYNGEYNSLISLTELEFQEAIKRVRNEEPIEIHVCCRLEVWILFKFWKDNPDMKIKDKKRGAIYRMIRIENPEQFEEN